MEAEDEKNMEELSFGPSAQGCTRVFTNAGAAHTITWARSATSKGERSKVKQWLLLQS